MAISIERLERPRASVNLRTLRRPQLLSWLGLAGVVALSLVLNLYRIGREGYANTYYAAAVKSMLQSWHNFFFVSFDPGGFVTVDKPPLGFWVQTASAKLFGFHGWSILLPEALAGAGAVALVFFIVRRVANTAAALLAALVLAVTPITVATSRNNTIDTLLVFTLLLGAWAVLKAAEHGSLRWLILALALVGLGFNIKTLEAYLVLPAFVALYFLAAPVSRWTRIWHLAVAGVVLLVISLSWMTAVDLTPASQRPYVGSSQHNSELELALGYNGLQRLLGHGAGGIAPKGSSAATRPASTASTASGGTAGTSTTNSTGASAGGSTAGGAGQAFAPPLAQNGNGAPPNGGPGGPGGNGGPGGYGENGNPGVLRLFDQQLGGQIAWLIPLALIGAVVAWGGGLRRLNRRQQTVLLFGLWLLTGMVFFSVAGFFHRYYLVMLGPAIAALAAIGVAALWCAYRQPGWRGWLLPATLPLAGAVQAYILRPYPGYNHWLTPTILALTVVAALLLVVARVRRFATLPVVALRLATVGGVLALLLAPAVWSEVTAAQANSGGPIPSAGPSTGTGGAFGRPPQGVLRRADGSDSTRAAARFLDFPGADGGQPPAGAPGANGQGGPGGPGGGTNSALVQYLEANRGGYTFLLAVPSSQEASSIILWTGDPVMAMGGFSGSDPILTVAQLQQAVANHVVRFFLVGGMGGPGGGNNAITAWIEAHGTVVQQTGTSGGGFGGGTLYEVTSGS